MKIEYALIKVSARASFAPDGELLGSLYAETEIVRKDSEEEVEEWLQEAFEMLADLEEKTYAYSNSLYAYNEAVRLNRNKRNYGIVESLGKISSKATKEYQDLTQKFEDSFGGNVVNPYDEYRIVKVYYFK